MVDSETIKTLLSFVGMVAAVMAVIVIACLITPKLAKLIEKKLPPARVDEKQKEPEEYKVQGAFESQKLEDYDLNYKIYNKDIYGVDFKHGKKQKRKDG